MSSSAASIAMTTTKPVVERLAPTVNSYANRGLDKLEGALPQICDEPEEVSLAHFGLSTMMHIFIFAVVFQKIIQS